jgi:enediyne biosynthesis protein E4
MRNRDKNWLILVPILILAIDFAGAQHPSIPPTAAVPKPGINAAQGVIFTEVTKEAGLGGFRLVSGTPAKDYIIEAPGAGCAFIDFDNDGWLDIYLVNGSTIDALRGKAAAPSAALVRNNRDGTFTDATSKAGVANSSWGQGVCAGDFDNDGWQDIYVTNFGKNRLYRNNRDGTFKDIAERAGVALANVANSRSWSTGCAFGDYDGDARLDLFVAGYIDFDIDNMPPPGSGAIASKQDEDSKSARGTGASYNPGANYCQYRGQRVMCGPRGLKGAPDYLFRNNGDGTFTDLSEKAGVADRARNYGFGVAWVDYDDDGRLDLAVANDSTPSYLYRNKGDGTFEDVSYVSGTALNENGREQAGMGIAIGDYDGDGRIDIFRTNFADDSDVLYHNDGDGNFTDVTFQMGLGEITLPFLGWGAHFFDYDNDGPLDLLVANGHIYPNVDAAGWGTTFKQRLLLFRNVKNRFYEVGSSAGPALYTPRASRGSSIGDFDNDGDLDILLNNIDDTPTLLRNDGGNKAGHWLTLKLVGNTEQKSPRDGIGAVVFCSAGGRRMRDEVASGRGFNSQSDLRVHFGLGTAAKIDKLEVRWANGTSEKLVIRNVDRVVTIEQGKGEKERTKQTK